MAFVFGGDVVGSRRKTLGGQNFIPKFPRSLDVADTIRAQLVSPWHSRLHKAALPMPEILCLDVGWPTILVCLGLF